MKFERIKLKLWAIALFSYGRYDWSYEVWELSKKPKE